MTDLRYKKSVLFTGLNADFKRGSPERVSIDIKIPREHIFKIRNVKASMLCALVYSIIHVNSVGLR